MLLLREGLPEEGELLLCEIKKVHFHSVFAKILEYGMEGMIHISEIAPGRIRNIRDYVKEGKFVVCRALRVNQEKRQVDLSLRRVNERERREKTNQITLEKKTEKLVGHIAKELKLDVKVLYRQLTAKLFSDYDLLYDAFMDVTEGRLDLDKLGLDPEVAKRLQELIKERIRPPEASIKGHLKITSFDPDGVEVIKRAMKELKQKVKAKFSIKYEGRGSYSLLLTAPDYEECEKVLKQIIDFFQSIFKEEFSFERE